MGEAMAAKLSKFLTEGRTYLGGSHFTLLIISFLFFNLQRSWVQIISAILVSFIVEYACRLVSSKNRERSIWDSLFSAFTESAGLLILIRSRETWFYAFISAIAVISKYVLTTNERKHFYNPTNIAIVLCLAFLPATTFDVRPDEFDVSIYSIFHVMSFGILAVYFGKTWRVTLGYVTGLFLFSAILSLLKADPFVYFLGPEIGAIGMIFMFLMITDPKTTPKNAGPQYVFGFAVAGVLYLLRWNELIYANYFALFLVTLTRGLLLFYKSVSPDVPPVVA